MLEHDSHVVLCPGADVDQDAGGAGGAEAEDQLLLSQVGSVWKSVDCLALRVGRCETGHLRREVVTDQGPGLKVTTHV